MPKTRRIIVPGLPHHVTQRGNRRCNIFCDDEDREVFMHLLEEASQRHALRQWFYSLMTNHSHFICTPERETSISSAMRDVLGPYAIYFNRRHGFKGHLWQGRFYSCVLDGAAFWHVGRYVELNPVRAGIVERAEQYRWSSAAAHVGLAVPHRLLEPLPELPASISSWPGWLGGPEDERVVNEIRRTTKTGRPWGSEEFIRSLEKSLGRELIVRQQGRPRKRDQPAAQSSSLPFTNK